MFGAILKATNSSLQQSMTLCCSIYVKKVMKLLAFIFEQPSYLHVSSFHEDQAFASLFVSTLLFSSILDTHTPISESQYDEIK